MSFSPQNYTTSEGASVPLTIVVDKVPAKDVTVTVTTMDITAEGIRTIVYFNNKVFNTLITSRFT